MECRLCCNISDKLWQSEPGTLMAKTINWYIIQATGINISKTQLIPNTLCHDCIKMSVRIYWFRCRTIERDKFLQDKYNQIYIPPLTRFEDLIEISPNNKLNLPDFAKSLVELQSNDKEIECENEDVTSTQKTMELMRPSTPETPDLHGISSDNVDQLSVHKTVKQLLDSNPDLCLPETVRKCDISPVIDLSDLRNSLLNTSADPLTCLVQLKSDNVYICSICNCVLETKNELVKHKRISHFECHICLQYFQKKKLLINHFKDHQNVLTKRKSSKQLSSKKSQVDRINHSTLNGEKTQREAQTDNRLLDPVVLINNKIQYTGLQTDVNNSNINGECGKIKEYPATDIQPLAEREKVLVDSDTSTSEKKRKNCNGKNVTIDLTKSTSSKKKTKVS